MNAIDLNTNSEIGSEHWFNTLMGRMLRYGEFIYNNPEHENVKEYGKSIQDTSRFIMDSYNKLKLDITLKQQVKLDEYFNNKK